MSEDQRMVKRNMCDGKKRHRAEHLAQKQIDAITGDRENILPYQCFYCPFWHVGHIIKEIV